jgi:hypothetical protein
MGLHDPFAYLKHMLWPKERSRVKLLIRFANIINQESPWFICIQVVCQILLESSQQGLQLCFKSHLNQRFAQKVMGLQSCKSPNFDNFETPNSGVLGQNDIWVQPPCPCIDNTIRGKVVASPKSGLWWSYEFVYAHGLSMHKKCYNYTLTNLLFGLCRLMWIVDLLVIHPSPHLGASTCHSYP